MPETFTRYTATQYERWDTISQANYGTPYLYERIRRANPTVTDPLFMTQGRVLLVPVIVPENGNTFNGPMVSVMAADKLPPWRR